MKKIQSPVDTFKIYARFVGNMPQWAYTCVLAGYVPPETEVEYQETKKNYPDILAFEQARESQKALEMAALKSLMTKDLSYLEREQCAQVCEQIDPAAGAVFAAAIRARGDQQTSKEKCGCGAMH